MYEYENTSEFRKYIQDAVNHLKNCKYNEAYELIMKAIHKDPNAPEPQNLLGLWYELKGMNDLARKHYRMAYVLNPVYKPASTNLERVSTLFPIKRIDLDYGEGNEEEMMDEVNTLAMKSKSVED